jgi:hypothetical protein
MREGAPANLVEADEGHWYVVRFAIIRSTGLCRSTKQSVEPGRQCGSRQPGDPARFAVRFPPLRVGGTSSEPEPLGAVPVFDRRPRSADGCQCAFYCAMVLSGGTGAGRAGFVGERPRQCLALGRTSPRRKERHARNAVYQGVREPVFNSSRCSISLRKGSIAPWQIPPQWPGGR